MSGHVVINVDGLESAALVESIRGDGTSACEKRVVEEYVEDGEEESPLIQTVECRICQEEDLIKNLEAPCSCSGSLKYAHRNCVQRWCDEKKDITCEICHQTYQPGYTAPVPSLLCPDDTTIDISGGWLLSGTPVDLHDPRFLAMAAAERRLTQYDEYAAGTNASGFAFCRFAALTLLALFLLRHALETTSSNNEDDEDVSTFYSIFMLRAFGFLLPCYIMACAISVLQRRREIEEEARLAASEVAFVLQSGQERGLHFTIVPGPAATQPEPHQ